MARDDFRALAARGKVARRHGQRSRHRKGDRRLRRAIGSQRFLETIGNDVAALYAKVARQLGCALDSSSSEAAHLEANPLS